MYTIYTTVNKVTTLIAAFAHDLSNVADYHTNLSSFIVYYKNTPTQ